MITKVVKIIIPFLVQKFLNAPIILNIDYPKKKKITKK